MRRRGIEGVAERYCQSYRWPFATPAAASVVRRFHASTALDLMRTSRYASRIAGEIVQHLVDHAVRKRVAKWVDQQIMSQGKNRFLVTSRPFGFALRRTQVDYVLRVQECAGHPGVLDAWELD